MIDLDRYPIHQPESEAYADLRARARSQFEANGYCQLPDFLCASGLDLIQAEIRALALQRADQRGRAVNCFYEPPPAVTASDDPRGILFDREFGVIRDDVLPEWTALRQLHGDQWLLRFIADVVGAAALFPSRDAYQGLTVNCMREGEHLHWHFDCNDFAVTLGIQAPIGGGELAFVQDIGRDNIAAIGRVLTGDGQDVPANLRLRRLETTEGALLLFRGSESMHRVLPVRGARERLVAALQYHRSDDAYDDPATTQRIYGIDPARHLGPKPSRVETTPEAEHAVTKLTAPEPGKRHEP